MRSLSRYSSKNYTYDIDVAACSDSLGEFAQSRLSGVWPDLSKYAAKIILLLIVVIFSLATVFIISPTNISAQIQQRGTATTASVNNASSIIINVPTEAVAGDLLLIVVSSKEGTSTGTVSSNLLTEVMSTELSCGNSAGLTSAPCSEQIIYSRVIQSGDPTSYTFDFNYFTQTGFEVDSRKAIAVAATYSGIDTASPINVFGKQKNTGINIVAPSISPNRDNTMLVGFFGHDSGNNIAEPASMISVGFIASGAGQDSARNAVRIAQEPWPTAGGTGTRTATGTNTTNAGQILAINPVPVANQPPSAPTLSTPADTATDVIVTPTFQLRSSDAENDYLRYRIEVCSVSDCSVIVRTIDQSTSQVGWSGQDAESGTAYVGSGTLANSTLASHTYQDPALSESTQYWWRAYAIDPGGSNTEGSISSIYSFTTVDPPPVNQPPAAPTLSTPADTAIDVSLQPTLQLRTTDSESNAVRYRIELCEDNSCLSVLRTIDQTLSQTGWSGQDALTGSAYVTSTTLGGSTLASHQYQEPLLEYSTQYWWRAYAIDPGGSNTESTVSSIFSFTTAAAPASGNTYIDGGANIQGGTRIGN